MKPLVNAFRAKDKNSDGVVDEDEFISIIEMLSDEADLLIPRLLEIVDPFEIKAITFAQMVKLLANYPEDNPILNRFIEEDYAAEDFNVQ